MTAIFLSYILDHYDRNTYREVFDDNRHYMKMVDKEYKCEVEKDESSESIHADRLHLLKTIILENEF